MQLIIHSISRSAPTWVEEGVVDYQKRFRPPFFLKMRTFAHHASKSIAEQKKTETSALLQNIPKNCFILPLDPKGTMLTTEQLHHKFEQWRHNYQQVFFLIGGSHGLDHSILPTQQFWSLSPLTFPHRLVRVMVAEQLYRVYSLCHHLPYHK